MNTDWLWDREISERETKRILSDPQNDRFIELASLLFSRKNIPYEIFDHYMSREMFVQNWLRIKRKMRKNKWGDQRIIFWQAVYDKLKDDFKAKGIPIRLPKKKAEVNEYCFQIGQKIRGLREEVGLTQDNLAKRLDVSQQVISRIENGRDNMSLLTLTKFLNCLGEEIILESRPKWVVGEIYTETKQ